MKKLFFILGVLFVLNGCQRENIIDVDTMPVDQPIVTVTSSLIGQVSDENGSLVGGALVYLDGHQTMSNELGVFEFNDILISKDAAYVQVEKDGYFKGSRKFSTQINETPYVKIELIEKVLIENIDTQLGGEVNVENSSVVLPAGEYQLQDGTKYSGEVFVYAKYLDPTKVETFDQMPGNLTGINLEGEEKVLASYGMIGVELISSSGEYLELPEGAQAEIELSVPASLLANAPATIPLWHFSDIQGIWVEEGEAVLQGNKYIGQVAHFSFWNCDAPFDLVELSGYVQINDQEYTGGLVKITDLASGTCSFGPTGDRGFFAGKVPKDRDLLLEVIGFCGEVIYEDQLGSLSDDLHLGAYNIVNSNGIIPISGVLDNCLDDLIVSGYVIVNGGSLNLIIPVNPDGSFYAEVPACNSSIDIEIYGIDNDLGLYGLPEFVSFDEAIDVNLSACDNFPQPGYEIFYDGQDWNPISLNDSMWIDFEIVEVSGTNGFEFNMSFTIIDPLIYDPLLGAQCHGTLVFSLDSDIVNYELIFESQGFMIEGVCEKEVEDFGIYQILYFYDVTDNIIILDSLIYPVEATEVEFSIRI